MQFARNRWPHEVLVNPGAVTAPDHPNDNVSAAVRFHERRLSSSIRLLPWDKAAQRQQSPRLNRQGQYMRRHAHTQTEHISRQVRWLLVDLHICAATLTSLKPGLPRSSGVTGSDGGQTECEYRSWVRSSAFRRCPCLGIRNRLKPGLRTKERPPLPKAPPIARAASMGELQSRWIRVARLFFLRRTVPDPMFPHTC